MKHQSLAAVLLVVGTVIGTSAEAAPKPSFDCARARTGVEKAICGDAALAAQDARIAKRYGQARKDFDADASKALMEDQRYFMQVRDDAYAQPFNSSDSPAKELADRMKYRDAFLASLSFKPRQGFEGQWDNLAGGVKIERQADGRLRFEGSGAQPYNGRWVCSVSGTGVVDGDKLVIKDLDDADGWALTLTRKGAALEVTENPPAKQEGFGPPYCGLNGYLSGVYFPVQ